MPHKKLHNELLAICHDDRPHPLPESGEGGKPKTQKLRK